MAAETSSQQAPVKIGIVGLGRMGWGSHVPAYESRPEQFRVVAACDVEADRLTRAAERLGCRTYGRFEDMIADPEVEIVDIATTSCYHYAQAIAALEAGKGVIVQKPMCMRHSEALAMVDASRRNSVPLFVFHNRRFEPAFNHVMEIIDSGLIGDVFEIKLRRNGFSRRNDWQTVLRLGGGQLTNWGPHLIDHGLRLVGGPVADIWSDLKRVAAVGDAEDHFHIILRGENGRVVDIEVSGGAAAPEQVYTVFGTRGGLTSDDNHIHLRYLDPDHVLPPRPLIDSTPPQDSMYGYPDDLKWIEETIDVSPASGANVGDIWDHFHAALRLGKPFPVTLEESVEVVRVTNEVYRGTEFDRG